MKKNVDDIKQFVSPGIGICMPRLLRIAAISPNAVLRGNLRRPLRIRQPVRRWSTPQPRDSGYLAQRLKVHSDLVAAIAAGDWVARRCSGLQKCTATRAESSPAAVAACWQSCRSR